MIILMRNRRAKCRSALLLDTLNCLFIRLYNTALRMIFFRLSPR